MKKMIYVSLYTVERAKIRQAKKYLQEMKKDMPCYCEIFVEGKKGKYETTKKPIYC